MPRMPRIPPLLLARQRVAHARGGFVLEHAPVHLENVDFGMFTAELSFWEDFPHKCFRNAGPNEGLLALVDREQPVLVEHKRAVFKQRRNKRARYRSPVREGWCWRRRCLSRRGATATHVYCV